VKITLAVGAVATVAAALAVPALPACDRRAPAPTLDEPETERIAWPEWRGADRDGSVSTEARSGEWPARAVRLWEREVGGGYSGPVVVGNRVWVHSRRGGAEIVSSLTLARGDTVWSQRYDVAFEQDDSARDHGRGPFATPAFADGRLFTLSMTSVLSAWDAESGALLWRRDYAGEFDPSYPLFGTASSPLVREGLCFVHVGDLGWGRPGRGAMVALDVADGRERWRWDGDGPSAGASPVMSWIGDRRHLIFKSQENIVGLDPLSGQELWRLRYSVTEQNTIVTPLVVGDLLVTSDWDMGLRAWRIERVDGTWRARPLWETRAASIFTSSPVVVRLSGGGPDDALVVGFSHFNRGQLFGLDPDTGAVVWRGPGRSGEHVSLVAWGDEVLVFQEDGSLVVGQVSRDGFHPRRTYVLGRSGTWAHPAIAGDRIIIRDGDRLAGFRFPAT